MLRTLTWIAVIGLAGNVVVTARAQEITLPAEAIVTRNQDGNISRVKLSGRSSANKAKIRSETIEQIGAIATLESLDLSFSDISDEILEPLKKLKSLKILSLSYSNVTGKAIRNVSALPHLLSLRLDGCKVTDDDLNVLADMPQLVNLYLRETQVTDAGLPQIAKLSELVLLDLSSCDITDEGLRSLGQFKQLQHLWLSVTIRYKRDGKSRLTDASVGYLSTLTTLRDLQIGDSQVTEKGLARLRDALPKANINATSIASTDLSKKRP